MNKERSRAGCAAIRAALSNDDVERILRTSGHSSQAIADAFAIGQASDLVADAFEGEPAALYRLMDAASERQQAASDLLDALARPDGRDVRKAWERACLLHGRAGDVMQRAAFEQYLDELAGIDS